MYSPLGVGGFSTQYYTMKNTINPNPDIAAIAALKTKHGNRLGQISVGEEGEEIIYIIKPADRKVMSASAKIAQTDNIAAVELMVKNTIVWGDVEALEDMRVLLAVAAQVEQYNAPKTAVLKNL
jgi:hypothetical protein